MAASRRVQHAAPQLAALPLPAAGEHIDLIDVLRGGGRFAGHRRACEEEPYGNQMPAEYHK